MTNRQTEAYLQRVRIVLLALILMLGMGFPSYAAVTEDHHPADSGNGQTSAETVSGTEAWVPFVDVTDTDWFYQAVQYVYNCSIMNGITADSFNPEGKVSRGMVVTVLYRMTNRPFDCMVGYFADVDYHEYYALPVSWAYEEKIVNGFEDGTFRPDESVTREQMAAILSRYLQQALAEKNIHIDVLFAEENHPDWRQISSWAEESMIWIVGNGLMKGSGSEQLLLPQNPMSRAELAQILQRSQEFLTSRIGSTNEAFSLNTESDRRSFADNLVSRMPVGQNWAISPYSLELCLAMLANGANGTTLDEILKTLQISDLKQYNQDVKTLLDRYDSYQSIMSLETANSIWINQDRFDGKGRFLQTFSDTLKTCYRAETCEVRDSNSVEEYNRWASEKTHGKIKQIADENQRSLPTALMNAVYFKAAWASPFSPEVTQSQTFHNQDGTESQIPFMHQTSHFDYFEADGIRAVRMPYKKYAADESTGRISQSFPDADFSMYIIMSDRDPDLQYVLDQAKFESQEVNLSIPKFKIEYGGALNNVLQSLGISAAFDPVQADLSGILDSSALSGGQKLYLDTAAQKAWIAIDEEGTEAAAVTFLGGGAGMVQIRKIIDFTADRPFYFVIRDDSSRKILFVGKYNQAAE